MQFYTSIKESKQFDLNTKFHILNIFCICWKIEAPPNLSRKYLFSLRELNKRPEQRLRIIILFILIYFLIQREK